MITYCINIHPGESWNEVLFNLQNYFLSVKKAVSPDREFPIGLRISNLASNEIDDAASSRFLDWCQQNNSYVPTINGFPYGSFHSLPIKENVYIPDWRYTERVEYTKRLVSLLNKWLPENKTGSISTVPVGFKKHISIEDYGIVRQNIMHVLEYIALVKQKSGKVIILSLEPEPGCILETTADVVKFFEKMEFPENLRENIGVCFDCCHHAVEFEEPSQSISMLAEAGINIGKIQVSSALHIDKIDREVLEKFCEPQYLHQVVIRKQDGTLIRYNDLSEALSELKESKGEEWRIHFHVPVFIDKMNSYRTTRSFTEEVISLIKNDVLFEVETYTWQVLPAELRLKTVTESIEREIKWVESQINEKNSCN